MRSRLHTLRPSVSLALILHCCVASTVHGADKLAATVLVKDTLAAPRQEATIEAKLLTKGLFRDSPLGGEPVDLVLNGATAATGMTGGDGRAVLSLVPPTGRIVPVQVRVGNSPRVSAAEGQANLVVWERRTPVLVVEFSSLVEGSAGLQHEMKPMPDAAEELAKLSQFYYGIMYVVPVSAGADGFAAGTEARQWLSGHKFPVGLVLTLSTSEEVLGAKIDELHQAGWKAIKTGIGRSKSFAETFLRRRLDAVVVGEPSTGEAPRKAKVAKDWKEVRKKL
jgi:hypothetical protein